MTDEIDSIARYGTSLGLVFRPRTVLVEGTTDVALFHLAAKLEYNKTGIDLLNNELAIVPAGLGDRGGTSGVIRQLIVLRAMVPMCLLPNGRPRYRFIGLVDNDRAGRDAVKMARSLDKSILEFKDVFRLWPVMPLSSFLDPGTLQKTFERANESYKGIEWEIEDLIAEKFIKEFLSEYPNAIIRSIPIGDKIHRELTDDGKAQFHRFIKANGIHQDVSAVIDLLKALRCYLGLKPQT